MKKYILFLIAFLNLSAYAAETNLISNTSSTNVSQQTGGNYIYAENGKLTFNFEPSLFEGRTWQYDASKDSAVVAFETNMPIKTKYSSTFHGYEVADNGQITLVAYYDESKQTPMLTKPIYRKGYEGRTVHVWLPAAGWVVRVVGAVARSVLPPIVARCLSNPTCAGAVAGLTAAGSWICGFNFMWNKDGSGFLREIGFPKGVCEKAEDDGWYKDENGQYVRDKQYKYSAHIQYGDHSTEYLAKLSEQYMPSETIGADTMEDLEKKIASKCNSHRGKSFNELDYDEALQPGNISGSVTGAELTRITNGFHCTVYFDDGQGALQAVPLSFKATFGSELAVKETLQFVDLENLVSEDFKKDPNPYINDKGQVGKEIREKINSSAAIMKKDGTPGNIALSSDPYKNPETGETQQDLLSISSGTSTWSTPDNGNATDGSGIGGSGGNSSGTGGSVPTGTNGVTMQTINRPDQSNTAKPADNNSPNGTGTSSSINDSGSSSGGSSGSQTGSENGSASGVSKGLDCSGEHKGILACAGVGEVQEDADGFSIPSVEDKTTFTPDYFLPTSGACPSPKTATIMGKQYEFTYYWICEFAEKIRALIIAIAFLIAGFIVFRRG